MGTVLTISKEWLDEVAAKNPEKVKYIVTCKLKEERGAYLLDMKHRNWKEVAKLLKKPNLKKVENNLATKRQELCRVCSDWDSRKKKCSLYPETACRFRAMCGRPNFPCLKATKDNNPWDTVPQRLLVSPYSEDE